MRYEEICNFIQNIDPIQLVAIEGFCSAGKSTLALRLSKDLNADLIHTDNYCTQRNNPPPYVDGLSLSKLEETLQKRDKSQLCVIEGICLRDILSLCGNQSAIFIYVRRIAENGLWHDLYHLREYEANQGARNSIPEPHASDLAYHLRVCPHELADILHDRAG